MSSRVFNARTSAGTCYFCNAGIARGQRVLYLTARAVDGRPDRPLNPRELREWRALGRRRRAARTRAARQAIVAPEWLWDRLTHVTCARSAGFPIPGQSTDAQRGTRSIGVGHGAQVVARMQAEMDRVATPAAPADETITVNVDCGRTLPYSSDRCTLQAGHPGACVGTGRTIAPERAVEDVLADVGLTRTRPVPAPIPAPAPAPAAETTRVPGETRAERIDRMTADVDPDARRMAAVMLDVFGDLDGCADDPAPVTDDPDADPGVARFRLLDLD